MSEAWATDVTYTVSSTSAVTTSGTAPTGSSATYASTYSTKYQLTSGNSMTLTLSGYSGKKITGITLSMKSNTSKGSGSLSVKAGTTTIASISDDAFNSSSWYGAWSTSFVDVNVSMSNDSYAIQNGENVVITIAATANSLYCQSFKLSYADASGGGSTTPSITASNVNIDYNATNGSIGYQLANATGNVSATVTSGDWLTLGTVTASAVPFTCSANTATTARTAQVKLSFTGATDKVVTVTQAAAGVANPSINVTSSSPTSFSYVEGNGPSDASTISVSGSNLTANISISFGDNSDYEMSLAANGTYTNSLTLTQSEGTVSKTTIYFRLKAGLAKGTHNGTLTLSSTGATDVVINLSGTVTGQTFAIEQYTAPANAHGTITFLPASPIEEGTEVTLSAEPAAGYDFTADSWVIYKQSGNDFVVDNSITVTANKFTMPAYAIWVDGTFTAKPTYDVTCVADPVAGGTIEAQPASAYEGQEVTLSYLAETGYELKSIVITKTSDGSATGITPAKSGDDYTFTMPAYAVTATAKFLSETYEGTFAIYSGNLTEGDYILVYDDVAMNNSLSNNKLGATSVKDDISDNLISNPSRSIVWHIAQSSTSGYWTIYNAKDGKYVCGTESNTNVSLVDSPVNNEEVNEGAIWSVSGTYDFKCKANEEQSTERYLRTYGKNSAFGNYASSNGGPLTLYKFTVLTDRTITFDGNGGTYNDATTYTQNVYDGVQAKLAANKFTKTDYEFVGWNTNANGENGTAYADGANITVTGNDLTLYAQWAPLYTLTIDGNIDGGSVAVEGDVTSAIEGTEITLTSTPTAGHKFSAWNVYKAGDTSTKVTVSDENKFTMPAYNVVISATFEEVQTYTLVTDVANIVSGKHYIIASGANGDIKAMGAQSNNIRSVVSVKASNGVIPETDGVYEFVIYGPNADGYYTIYDAKYDNNNGGYLYASSGTSNYMGTQASNDANGKWSIEIANTGAATINAHGINTHDRMRFNGDRFSCYLSSTNVSALPYLYVKDGDTPVATTASVKLNAYGYATFASTSALDFLDADKAEYSAWQITKISDTAITFSQITSMVKAGTGILLKGTPDATINLNLLPAGGNNISSTNKLEGVTEARTINANEYYALSGNQFVKVKAGNVPAGKALLPASAIPSSARQLTIVFDDETTGISAIESGQWIMDNVYDLQGRRVMKPTKGLYIVNGKKVVIK